jgi:two-component system C4-dicarboxylate transport response regulator DctD
VSIIMLVSADKEMGKVIKAALSSTPVRLSLEFDNPKAACDALAVSPIAMVILDLFVPGTSGLEMIKALKRVNENCPFMLLNRMRTRAVIERAFRYGAQDVLPYPVSTEVLRDTILHRLESEPLSDADEDQASKLARKK